MAGIFKSKKAAVAALVAVTAVTVPFIFHTAILRWTANHLALGAMGLRIEDAGSLSLNPAKLLEGSVAFSGQDVRILHAAVATPISVKRIDGSINIASNTLNATFRIDTYPGAMEIAWADGGLSRLSLAVTGAGRQIAARYKRTSGQIPSLMIIGRSASPILAALIDQPDTDLASLPDTINILLGETAPGKIAARYGIQGQALDVAGSGGADLKTRQIFHSGRVRLNDDAGKAEDPNRYRALQNQIDLAVTRVAPLLTRFAVRSRIDLMMNNYGGSSRYAFHLDSNGGQQGSNIGRLFLSRRALQEGAAATVLIDATIRAASAGNRLSLSGKTGILGQELPLSVAISGGGEDEPIERMAIRLGRESAAERPLVLDVEFVESLLGGITTVSVKTGGGITLAAAPQGASLADDFFSILRAIDPAVRRVSFSGEFALEPGLARFDNLKISGGSSSLAIDGVAGKPEEELSLNASLASFNTANLDRIMGPLAQLRQGQAPSAAALPRIRAKASIGRLVSGSAVIGDIRVSYDPSKALEATFGILSASGQTLATKGEINLPLPLRPGVRMAGNSESPWGPVRLEYVPNNSASIERIFAQGGKSTVSLPGIVVRGLIPATGAQQYARFEMTIDPPGQVPALGKLLGSGVQYWPDEPTMATAIVSMSDARIRSVVLMGRSIRVNAEPTIGGNALLVDVRGSAASLLRGQALAPKLARLRSEVHARFLWRNLGAVHAIDDLTAELGGMRANGSLVSRAGQLNGKVTIEADQAKTVAGLFPAITDILPRAMLDSPMSMPVDIRSDPNGMVFNVRTARIGALVISSTALSQRDGQILGEVAITGPLGTTLLTDLPSWVTDTLGPKQQLNARLAIRPGEMIRVSGFQLVGDRLTMSGNLALPLKANDFDWKAAQGDIAGEIGSVRYDQVNFPKAQYVARINSEGEFVAGRVNFAVAGGGTLGLRFGLSGGANMQSMEGRVELAMRNIDLASLCRDSGFRLLGAGQLDGDLKGSAPAALFVNSNGAESLFENILRTARASGQLIIRNGVLLNVDLARRAQDAGDRNGGVAAGARTAFEHISGDLTMTSGQIRIDNGRFVTPDYGLSISGTMTAPQMLMDFQVRGKIALVTRASTGKAVLTAPLIPLRIAGRPSKPSYEFLPGQAPGVRTVTNAVVGGVKTLNSIDSAIARSEAKASASFSKSFFGPLLGKKVAEAAAAAATKSAAEPAPAARAPSQAVTRGPVCGA